MSRSLAGGVWGILPGRHVLTLIRRARQRLFQNELLFQGANAGSAALLAFILLMLLGTQILSWQFALLIPVTAAVVGLFAARKRTPSEYRAAQLIDRRLGLADALSTAHYFAENPSAPAAPEIRSVQLQNAERAAAAVDVRQAIPFTMPRSLYATAALFVVASSLFALRYGLTRSLDLQPPLARILQQTFGKEEPVQEANNRRRQPKQDQASADNQSLTPDEQQEGSEQPKEPESTQEPNDQADAAGKPGDKAADDKSGDVAEPAEDGDKSAQSEDQQGNSDDSKSGNPGESKSDNGKEGGKNESNQNNENSSLFNKVKDFAQNLLSKVKQPNQSAGQQKSQEQQSKQGKGEQSGSKQQSKDGQKQQGQQGDSQEGEGGEQADSSQDPDGKGNGKNDSKQSNNQPGSGMGSQDGDKRIKQAEQLAAMGKISEIIGKRSATVTGEATIEVKSTSQQIRTPYAQRGSQHTQAGTEINRDEVPVALQSYVEQYFEQVRKQPAPAKPAAKK